MCLIVFVLIMFQNALSPVSDAEPSNYSPIICFRATAANELALDVWVHCCYGRNVFLCIARRHGNATCKSQKLCCDNKYVLQELVHFLPAHMRQILHRPRGKRRGRGDCKCALIKVLRLSGPFVFLLRLVEPLWLIPCSLSIVTGGNRAWSDSPVFERNTTRLNQ